MMGWLINGVWVAISSVTGVVWLVLSDDGKKWVKAESIKQWTDTPEDKRAIQISSAGEQFLIERPKTIERFDISPLMYSDTQQMQQPQKRPDAAPRSGTGLPAEVMAQLDNQPAAAAGAPKPIVADGNLVA